MSFQPDKDTLEDRKPYREWKDVTFLGIKPLNSSENETTRYSLRKHQMSCGLIGFDKNNWTAYGFFDGNLDEEEQEVYLYDNGDGTYSPDPTDKNECTSTPNSEPGGTGSPGGLGRFCTDPVAGGMLDAAMPCPNPREYFLKVLEIRAEKMSRRWGNLVLMHLKDAIWQQVRSFPATAASSHRLSIYLLSDGRYQFSRLTTANTMHAYIMNSWRAAMNTLHIAGRHKEQVRRI